MIHLRVVAPPELAAPAVACLTRSEAVSSVVHLRGAATKPAGDLILCDVAREQASVLVAELTALGLAESGSITIEEAPTVLSAAADRAERAAPDLAFGDQVVWEDVEARTSEETALSVNFVEFMLIAGMLAAIGILLDSPILIVGAMVVGPEFGPLAALCVALVQKRAGLARRSAVALAAGFGAVIPVVYAATAVFRAVGVAPQVFPEHPLTLFISNPDLFSFLVAYMAGTAGILSLTSAKSGALVGVLISVTTIPAAANIGVAGAYSQWGEVRGAVLQLVLNLVAIVAGGVARMLVQRRVYLRRARLASPARTPKGEF
ncbi:MAG TPA: DUF389 domain-containing protein [Mycobacteriales bacterium]|nr:DUF389 domain-containing protein [Mycobacteriales bacterium]